MTLDIHVSTGMPIFPPTGPTDPTQLHPCHEFGILLRPSQPLKMMGLCPFQCQHTLLTQQHITTAQKTWILKIVLHLYTLWIQKYAIFNLSCTICKLCLYSFISNRIQPTDVVITFCQVIRGIGVPTALALRTTGSPSFTWTVVKRSTNFGATTCSFSITFKLHCNNTKVHY